VSDETTTDEGDEQPHDDHHDDVADDCGCAGIWGHLTERRNSIPD
jgi:hypothetical protein